MPRSRAARWSPDTHRILDDVRRVVRALRESSRAAERRVGLSGAQLFVLRALAGPAPCSVNELAARTRTHQSSVSVVARRLVERGLVARARASDDRRRLALALTPAGRRVLARSPGAAQERLIDGIERLAPAERRGLARALSRLTAAMRLADAPPPMFFEGERPAPQPRRRRAGRAA